MNEWPVKPGERRVPWYRTEVGKRWMVEQGYLWPDYQEQQDRMYAEWLTESLHPPMSALDRLEILIETLRTRTSLSSVTVEGLNRRAPVRRTVSTARACVLRIYQPL